MMSVSAWAPAAPARCDAWRLRRVMLSIAAARVLGRGRIFASPPLQLMPVPSAFVTNSTSPGRCALPWSAQP